MNRENGERYRGEEGEMYYKGEIERIKEERRRRLQHDEERGKVNSNRRAI